MAVSWNRVTTGDVLLDIHRHYMGNTKMLEWGCWKVKVVSMDSVTETAMCSWNGNQPKQWSRKRLERLYRKPTKAYLLQQERRKRGAL